MDGDVTVAVEWSTVNYKDGLAITGRSPVVRRFPMIAGIDFAGVVEASSHPDWKPGDRVILNGWGVGETPSRRLCREGAGQGRLAGAAAAGPERARRHGDRHRRLHRHARGDGAGTPRPQARSGTGGGHRSRGRRRIGRGRDPGQARLPGYRLHRPVAGGRLPQAARSRRNHRPQRASRPGEAARQGALGRRPSTRSVPRRSPMSCR